MPLSPPTKPYRYFSIDFIIGLPPSLDKYGKVYNTILVIVDRFSKLVRYIPYSKTITLKGLADI